jgi:acyl carrier protein
MEEKQLRRNLYRVLRKTGVRKNDIQLSASFYDDLNFDTLDWEIFNFYLTGYFKLNIRENETIRFSNVNETLNYLRISA